VDENIAWRRCLIDAAENDVYLQQDLFSACESSILFWFNAFCWTYLQFIVDPETNSPIPAPRSHLPFVTWEIQDGTILKLRDAIIKGHDIGIKKCRDMGASWMCLAVFHWFWLFRSDSQLLELSRNEDYVDKAGNAKSLFWKHDYINGWLPEWMCPPDCLPNGKNRTKMHLNNVLNGSVIDGESTTAKAASGDRRLAILLDEFSKVENGQAMRSATADVTPCRIVNSTPCGAGTEYSRWMNSGQIKVIQLPFYEHPNKGLGRYIVQDSLTGMYKIRSPWFDNEEKFRRSPKEMAQEILMDDIESGSTFFEANVLEQHRALFARDPICRMNVDFKKNTANDALPTLIRRKKPECVSYNKHRKGKWAVWTNLLNGRPDQSKTYIMGIDLGKGQGASNSVISVVCKETQEKILEFADANVPPYEMARLAVAAALWIGGANPRRLPFIIWEMNGPGWDFGRLVVKIFKYPYYYKVKKPGVIGEKQGKKYGWHTNKNSKQELLGGYRRLLAHGGFINHCKEAIDEAELYVDGGNGAIIPACLVEEKTGARQTHGDRVMADALCTLELNISKILKHSGPTAPPRSHGYRKEQRAKKLAKQKALQGSGLRGLSNA
jgi:hypothetical protein